MAIASLIIGCGCNNPYGVIWGCKVHVTQPDTGYNSTKRTDEFGEARFDSLNPDYTTYYDINLDKEICKVWDPDYSDWVDVKIETSVSDSVPTLIPAVPVERIHWFDGTIACTEGESKCYVSSTGLEIVRKCVGGVWVDDDICGYNEHCEESNGTASCVADPVTCDEGEYRCSPSDPYVIQKCVEGEWVGWGSCPHGCEEYYGGARCKPDPDARDYGALQGKVTDRQGWWLNSVKVSIASETEYTANGGTYSFPMLQPGNYVVTFKMYGYRDHSEFVDIVADKITTLDVKLEAKDIEGDAFLWISSWDARNVAPGDASIVRYANVQFNSYNGVTDEHGDLIIDPCELGTWVIKVSKSGFQTQRRTIVLDANLCVDFYLVPNGMTPPAKHPTRPLQLASGWVMLPESDLWDTIVDLPWYTPTIRELISDGFIHPQDCYTNGSEVRFLWDNLGLKEYRWMPTLGPLEYVAYMLQRVEYIGRDINRQIYYDYIREVPEGQWAGSMEELPLVELAELSNFQVDVI